MIFYVFCFALLLLLAILVFIAACILGAMTDVRMRQMIK